MVWLIGNKGMLGTELSMLFEKKSIPFIGTDIEVDITDQKTLITFVQGKDFKWIINCAAYTAVDKAEDDSENCRMLNTVGAGNIALTTAKIDARMIHISTDYVFNGQGNLHYNEDDNTDPIGVYGLTKRDGEIKVLEGNVKSYIIRTAWLYGKYGSNFVHTMIKLMNERSEIKVVDDQRGSPTWAFDLAMIILTFINAVDTGKEIPYGIYHYTNEADISWFDFAREIYYQGHALGIIIRDCEVKPCISAEFPAKVKRPSYSVLDKTKIKKNLGITLPFWKESLGQFLINYP